MKLLAKLIARLFGLSQKIYFSERYLLYKKKFQIADDFRFNGDAIEFYGNGKIIIGYNSYIGSRSILQSANNCLINIGNNCAISHNVRIYTESSDPNQNFNTKAKKIKKNGNVLIGSGVWIGANVLINPGVVIGDNVVIGANSVVTKNIDNYSIVGGVPAKLIRRITLDD